MADRHDDKELPIFRLFALACGLPIKPDSIEKREPPEPDILCNVTGEGAIAGQAHLNIFKTGDLGPL